MRPFILALCLAIAACGNSDGGAALVDASSPADGNGPLDSSAPPDGALPGDTYLPWEGGPAYYAKWSHGPSTAADFFPVAVWLQDPGNAARYKALGVNTFIGLWQGPTDAQVSALDAAGLSTVCSQEVAWAKHLADAAIVGWQQMDEPDNAQPDGKGGYGPCVDPAVIQSTYATDTKNDANRPVYLNLGQGVAYDNYIGRGGACAGKLDMYAAYEKGADIVSFDIYPVNNTDKTTHANLWFVPLGVDRLRQWSNYQKAVWSWIETTQIDANAAGTRPTPDQVRAEVWMALVHGSRGIGYFVHTITPFVEQGIFGDPAMVTAVTAINQQIHDLAPVLNQPPLANGATVDTGDLNAPVDILVKRHQGALYVFAVAMRPSMAIAKFTPRGVDGATVTVLGEGRSLAVSGGKFQDAFGPYAVHLYKVGP